ncbi:PTS glucose/sucrose transporter subunit IIB [Streptomyces sp. CA-142005]|uniref:PTS glucose/sucrose transporter subunit IIB n=1 Tax=Streptomyces sp. CA-142005 TaxID=3240052 RepID=UPI003D907213
MRNAPASAATAILHRVGGPANITSVGHCMTRLRLTLADPTAVDEEGLRTLPGVLGVVSDGPTRQIVLGPGVVATAALTAASAATLAAPAHADDHWTATDTATCAGNLVAAPAVKSVSPLPLGNPMPRCGKGSLIHQGR